MPKPEMKRPIQILELFGGVGAPRAALRNLGIPVKSIDYVEIDEKAVRTYNAMFADDMAYKTQDVRGWNLQPDILIHGSPCQDFSHAGHRKGADPGSKTRSSLMWETIKIIQNMGVWKPRIVIWENVKGVLHKRMRPSFDRYLEEMAKMGYTSSYAVLNARDFGLPQNRERVFTVSMLGGMVFDFSRLEHKPMEPIESYLEDRENPSQYNICPSMMQSIGQKKPGSKFHGFCPIIETHCNAGAGTGEHIQRGDQK